jgi:hypothetical protein
MSNIHTQSHYIGKDSLYKFAEEWALNAYEFDIIKRVVRCRYKGSFTEDLTKTQDLIDIYLQEQQHKYIKVTPDYLDLDDPFISTDVMPL